MKKTTWFLCTWLPLLLGIILGMFLTSCTGYSTSTTTPVATTTPAAPTLKITSPTGNVYNIGNVNVTIEVTNFKIVDKQGGTNVPGEGHVHYYLDVDAPTTPGQPAIPTSGVWAHVASTNYTFTNVTPGTHTVYVELVNNDHTPLSPAVVTEITITVTAATKTPPPPTSFGITVTIDLAARNFAFDKSTITVSAGANVIINFNNQDTGVPHNFALYTNQTAQTSIFKGDTITGPTTITYKFTAPTASGTYFFRCDTHPNMNGSFVVQ